MAFKIHSTTERLESVGGLAIAGEIARRFGLNQITENNHSLKSVLMSMYGLLVQGRSSFEEISLFKKNEFFAQSFGLTFVPAQETLRLYLEKLSENSTILDQIKNCNQKLLKHKTLTPITVQGRNYLPVDVDVSVMDNSGSSKEGVSRTYMGIDGYAPIFSYIGAEGFMLDCELRPGSQHCQKGTPDFLQRNIKTIKDLAPKFPVLFRLDGGNDSVDTINALIKKSEQIPFFIIKRNLRRESPFVWLETAQVLGVKRNARSGKTVFTGVITKQHPKADADMPEFDIVFQVTERTIDRHGNQLLISEIEVETWWTNMYETPENIIALYHDHGTSEQFHSELKSDMNVERLPSGKMKVNALVLTLAMFAFNTLRLIGQSALAKSELHPYKITVKRKRLKKVISDLIYIGCKFVRHARGWILKIHKDNPWLPVFQNLYQELQT